MRNILKGYQERKIEEWGLQNIETNINLVVSRAKELPPQRQVDAINQIIANMEERKKEYSKNIDDITDALGKINQQ